MVAGARVTRTRLAMPASGGRWDWLLHGLLPRVGFARRRFDPRAFTYLRLRDVVLRDGHAAQWSRFVGALMSRFETHMALLVLDPHTRIYARLDRARLFGRFARATRQELLVLATACNEIARPCLEARGEPLAITSPDM